MKEARLELKQGNKYWLIPLPKECLPPLAEKFIEVCIKNGLKRGTNSPILSLNTSEYFDVTQDPAPNDWNIFYSEWPVRFRTKHFDKKGLVGSNIHFRSKQISSKILKKHQDMALSFDLYSILREVEWETSLNFGAIRETQGGEDIIPIATKKRGGGYFTITEEVQLSYRFGTDKKFKRMNPYFEGSPQGETFAILNSDPPITEMKGMEKKVCVQRPLRVWTIVHPNDPKLLLPKKGYNRIQEERYKKVLPMEDYDEIIETHFKDSKIPKLIELKNMDLEYMVLNVIPEILSNMSDFVEN